MVQVLDRLDPDAIRRLLEAGEFLWVDLESPSPDDVKQLGELLELHHLAVEDSLEFGQRPKLDEYDDKVLLVFYAIREHAPVEVHVHISGRWLVTIHLEPGTPLAHARRRVEGSTPRTEEEAIYYVLDAMTDSFFPLLERFSDEVDDLEDAMLAEPSVEQRHQLFSLRRKLVPLRRIVAQQRDTMVSGGELIERLPGFEADLAHDYFRDVYDHLIRIASDLDSLRDRLTSATELLVSNQGNRLNEVMKRLTIISTIFLPLSFLTGFFGQNFGWMVDHVRSRADFLVFGIGGLVVSGLALVVYFWRAGFFGR